jgi:peptidoglycan biosynthesis protein MviN/MurJ (putative lipid II flippase)
MLIALGGVLVGGAVGQVLSSSFYAFGDTSTPTRVGVAGFTLGLILKVGGFFLEGIHGIAVGTSAYYMINAVALYCLLAMTVRGKCFSSRGSGIDQ